ncbi:OmpH family outer membrane protein [Treponema sp.]|uniref:OmpH family outer membrane protein n=1 Tax=Treponema sp. TaxID=166 RepID=UPI0025EC8025|nr:OmpH family outer membrane protein [Treponema sp.]MCR5219110.1 OmpH family outer membrane protein [Treponema sp.]
MKSLRKYFIVLGLTLICSASGLFAQQITKFAVVDTARVYQAYYRDSSSVRNYESKKAEFQKEINKLVSEIQGLHDKKLEYQRAGKDSDALKVEQQITKKTEYLNEYTNAKNMELKTLETSLQNNNEFYKKLYSTLERVAETGGYSMILSLQQNNAILWYSPSVDVTDEVISRLGISGE